MDDIMRLLHADNDEESKEHVTHRFRVEDILSEDEMECIVASYYEVTGDVDLERLSMVLKLSAAIRKRVEYLEGAIKGEYGISLVDGELAFHEPRIRSNEDI